MRSHAVGVFGSSLAILFAGAASAAGQPTTVPAPTEAQKNMVADQLQRKDAASIDAAIKQMKIWAAGGKVPGAELSRNWLPSLVAAGRLEEVADLCLEIVLGNPSAGNIEDFLSIRVRTLEALGKNDQALQVAKSLYNDCDMKYIDKALPIVAHALELTHPDDKSIGRRFSLAQAQSTGRQSATSSADDAALLRSVKIDTAIYEKALAQWATKKKQGTLTIEDSHDIEKYANLLLVADKGQEAEAIFRDLIKNTPGEANRQKSALLRALKAVDGNLTRASSAQSAASDKAMP